MEAKVIWKQRLSFDGMAESGYIVPLSGRKENGGDEDGFRPMEMLAIGLAACTAMDVISILQKKRQEVSGFEVLLHGQRATEHPKKFTHIQLEYVVSGSNIDPAAVERSVQLSEEKYCSAIATLKDCVPIEHKIRIIDAVKNASASE
jgi:putative redox protein